MFHATHLYKVGELAWFREPTKTLCELTPGPWLLKAEIMQNHFGRWHLRVVGAYFASVTSNDWGQALKKRPLMVVAQPTLPITKRTRHFATQIFVAVFPDPCPAFRQEPFCGGTKWPCYPGFEALKNEKSWKGWEKERWFHIETCFPTCTDTKSVSEQSKQSLPTLRSSRSCVVSPV